MRRAGTKLSPFSRRLLIIESKLMDIGRSVSDTQTGGLSQTAFAGFRFEPDGDVYEVRSTGDTLVTTDWLGTNRGGAGSDYTIRVEVFSGSIDTANSDAVNTWLSMSVNRSWRCFALDNITGINPVVQEAKIKVFIRDASNVVRIAIDPADPGGIGNSQLWHMRAEADRI